MCSYEFSPGSAQAINGDALLWRYLNLEKFLALIDSSKLYHARLDKLGDPLEGSVTQEHARLRAANTNPAQAPEWRYEPVTNQSQLYTTYATCWHASEHESHALWDLYAKRGSGVAIVSSVSRLLKAVDISPYKRGILRQVEYLDFQTDPMRLPPFFTEIRPCFAKQKCFEHEKEVRGIVLAPFPAAWKSISLDTLCTGLRAQMPLGVFATVDLPALLQAIILGPSVTPDIRDVVERAASAKGLGGIICVSATSRQPLY